MVDNERQSDDLSLDRERGESEDFHRIIPPPSRPVERSSGAVPPVRWKWMALGLGSLLTLTLLLAPINGPLGSPFLRPFRHLTIPDPSHPTDRSLGGPANPSARGVTDHHFAIAILGVKKSAHWWRLRVEMTNTGTTPVLAQAGTTATLTVGGQLVSSVNPEASRNDFYTAINPEHTVTGWLAFPMSAHYHAPVTLTIPHLFRLNTPLWTARVPVP